MMNSKSCTVVSELHTVKACMLSDITVLHPFCDVVSGCELILQHFAGREELGLGGCSTAGSSASPAECHGGTSWQWPLQAAGYQPQCAVGGETRFNLSLLHLLYALHCQHCTACTGYSVHTMGTVYHVVSEPVAVKEHKVWCWCSAINLALLFSLLLFWHKSNSSLVLSLRV